MAGLIVVTNENMGQNQIVQGKKKNMIFFFHFMENSGRRIGNPKK